MTQIEAIKKEIERLKERAEKHELLEKFGYKYGDSRTYETGLADAFDWILSFIESLEQKSQCDGCVNDKGCVTCVDWNMKETQPKGYDEAYLQEKIDLAKKNGSWREGLEKEQPEEPKIKGWAARDEDGILTFSFKKPERAQNGDVGYWFGGDFLELSKEGFPDLKWKDDPIEVELEIHRV